MPTETIDRVPLVSVCVSSRSWEPACWWDVAFLTKREEIQIRENRSSGKGWHVSTSGIPKPVRAVKEWKMKKRQRKKGARWSRARQKQTWAHIPLPDYKIPASGKRVQTIHTHIQTHWHLGLQPHGSRCKPRHTCRNTNSMVDITVVHAHACMLGREEIPEGTGGSGDSNLSGWLWSPPCLCHRHWKPPNESGLPPINHNVCVHAKMSPPNRSTFNLKTMVNLLRFFKNLLTIIA